MKKIHPALYRHPVLCQTLLGQKIHGFYIGPMAEDWHLIDIGNGHRGSFRLIDDSPTRFDEEGKKIPREFGKEKMPGQNLFYPQFMFCSDDGQSAPPPFVLKDCLNKKPAQVEIEAEQGGNYSLF